MRIPLPYYLEEKEISDIEDLKGARVLYRYHRKSRKVYGKIDQFSFKTGKAYVLWEDGKQQWVCAVSLEVIV